MKRKMATIAVNQIFFAVLVAIATYVVMVYGLGLAKDAVQYVIIYLITFLVVTVFMAVRFPTLLGEELGFQQTLGFLGINMGIAVPLSFVLRIIGDRIFNFLRHVKVIK